MSLLEISHLTTKFETQQGTVSAVRDVSYHLEEGEVLGIVGESGSGKIVGMIFQDPMTFLNPILKIGIQMTEGIRKHQNCSKKEAEAKAIELMRQVGIPSPEKRLDQYPFEFSGGMRRRIIIATALACDPELIIADEPTTALDVTIQAQILELLKKLTKEKGTSVIMITHDLGVVASMCDRIAIMYAGQIVEEGTVDEIFYEPHHPYTKGLLNSINNSAKDNDEPLVPIPGTPPDLLKLPKGCAFMSRCPYTMKICEVQASPVTTYSETHCCRCWLECMDETKITVSGEEAALEDSMAGSHFYPDFAAVLLKQKVAEQYGLKAENVLGKGAFQCESYRATEACSHCKKVRVQKEPDVGFHNKRLLHPLHNPTPQTSAAGKDCSMPHLKISYSDIIHFSHPVISLYRLLFFLIIPLQTYSTIYSALQGKSLFLSYRKSAF